MTYTDFLKSHFGEDGSLARVLQELEKKTKIGDNYIEYFGYGHGHIIECEDIQYYPGIGYFCNWDITQNLYNQSPETQRKIAELLGWRE